MVDAIMVGEATALSAALPLAGAGGIVGGAVGGVCGSVVGGGVGVLTQDKEVGQLTGAVVGGVTGGVAGGLTGNFMVPGHPAPDRAASRSSILSVAFFGTMMHLRGASLTQRRLLWPEEFLFSSEALNFWAPLS